MLDSFKSDSDNEEEGGAHEAVVTTTSTDTETTITTTNTTKAGARYKTSYFCNASCNARRRQVYQRVKQNCESCTKTYSSSTGASRSLGLETDPQVLMT